MKEDYETIVRRFYNDLRPKFIHVLTGKYPMLRLDEAEDLYQDAFLEVYKNFNKGSVRDVLGELCHYHRCQPCLSQNEKNWNYRFY